MMSRNFASVQILIDKLSSDDAAALEELSRRYCYSLYSYCMTKLNSAEDAKRITRNVFISLWENREILPADFSISAYLYTEVRKSVVQCVNSKLEISTNIPDIEKQIIPGFRVTELQKAKQPVTNCCIQNSRYYPPVMEKRNYEEQWWTKYLSAVNPKSLMDNLKSMLNF